MLKIRGRFGGIAKATLIKVGIGVLVVGAITTTVFVLRNKLKASADVVGGTNKFYVRNGNISAEVGTVSSFTHVGSDDTWLSNIPAQQKDLVTVNQVSRSPSIYGVTADFVTPNGSRRSVQLRFSGATIAKSGDEYILTAPGRGLRVRYLYSQTSTCYANNTNMMSQSQRDANVSFLVGSGANYPLLIQGGPVDWWSTDSPDHDYIGRSLFTRNCTWTTNNGVATGIGDVASLRLKAGLNRFVIEHKDPALDASEYSTSNSLARRVFYINVTDTTPATTAPTSFTVALPVVSVQANVSIGTSLDLNHPATADNTDIYVTCATGLDATSLNSATDSHGGRYYRFNRNELTKNITVGVPIGTAPGSYRCWFSNAQLGRQSLDINVTAAPSTATTSTFTMTPATVSVGVGGTAAITVSQTGSEPYDVLCTYSAKSTNIEHAEGNSVVSGKNKRSFAADISTFSIKGVRRRRSGGGSCSLFLPTSPAVERAHVSVTVTP